MQVTTIGLDLGKRVFQVHGIDASGRAVVRRKLQRSEIVAFFAALPPCLVGIEACATAHHWSRLITAGGHDVRLIPPSYVKPYVRRSKTDAPGGRAGSRSGSSKLTRQDQPFVSSDADEPGVSSK
jgi:transposase